MAGVALCLALAACAPKAKPGELCLSGELAAPQLGEPAEGSVLTGSMPLAMLFYWENPADACLPGYYQLGVARSEDFSDMVLSYTTPDNATTTHIATLEEGCYFWRVVGFAQEDTQAGRSSAVYPFCILADEMAATATPTPTATPEPVAGYPAQSACDHPYYPIRQGAVWTYATGDKTFTTTVTEVIGDKTEALATLETVWSSGEINVKKITCKPDKWVESVGEQFADWVSIEVSGLLFLPADKFDIGGKWKNTKTLQKSDTGATLATSSEYEVIGWEEITWGNETVQALMVKSVSTQLYTVPGIGQQETTYNVRDWYIEGIGRVRWESKDLATKKITSGELTEYNIPEP
jgi:hypothetical protein